MKKDKGKKELKKVKYMKPVLIKHKKLKDITAQGSFDNILGSTKF
jgi:hypothetical protein